LTTAGRLLFAGDVSGNFTAHDVVNGNPLWHTQLGANTTNAAETYMVDGRQYILVGAGDTLYAFALY
jgi:alcohol dehydrogenase (cytochrome c)